jgi:ceramide glucosyltransferase
MLLVVLALLAVVAGSWVYCVLVVIASWRHAAVKPPVGNATPPISVLKPLCGWDDELEQNLASFFEQDYPAFELIFSVHDPGDAAVSTVERLRERYPGVPSKLVVTGEPPIPNRKVWSLHRMVEEAKHTILVTGDSDVRAGRGMLRTVAAEMEDERAGLVTCPYRAEPGRYNWCSLEAVGLNTDFLGGVLAAAMLDGVKFALGPALAVRREALEQIGGFLAFRDYLAEDFLLGQRVAAAGWKTRLSSFVVEHRIGAPGLWRSLKHQLRWARSTRRSRRAGYAGLLFTNPLPPALLAWMVRPELWPVVVAAGVFRASAAWATSQHVLKDPLVRRRWWLVPAQDLVSFAVWIAGFFGRTVVWRGRRYRLLSDGRFRAV